ncbi:MAG: DUF308 domain-containing protein [Eubacterium sp.]|nr:DUF308 domain-containing protein [Eubacterium sp.]
MMKTLKWSIIVLAVAYIVLGVVLIMYPSQVQKLISYLLAIALIAVGIVNLIQYVKLDSTQLIHSYDLCIGFSTIIGGVLIIINVDRFSQLIFIVMGFMILVSGVLKLQNSVNLMRLHSPSWQMPFCLAMVGIVYGVIMLINPFGSGQFFFVMMGIGFIISGITDLIVTVMVSIRLKQVTDLVMTDTENTTGGGN